jgi:hypothetical protein
VSPPVSRADRVRDLAAITLLVAGAGLYLYAHAGMRSLAAGAVQGDLAHPLMAHWDRYWQLSRAGLVMAGAGIGVGIWSFVRFVVRRPAPEP